MRISGIVVEPPGAGRVWLLSKASVLFFAFSLKRSGDCAFRAASGGRLDIASVAGAVGCRIRCADWRAARLAASLRLSAGAETALFYYHRYFTGSQCPAGEAI